MSETEKKGLVAIKNLWECSLQDIVQHEKALLNQVEAALNLDTVDEDETQDLMTLVFAARDMIQGKIDNIVFLHKSTESNLAELKLAYERQKFRLDRLSSKLKDIVSQGIVNRDLGNKISGNLFAANRVGTDSCIVDLPNLIQPELLRVEVSIKASFSAKEQEELEYWQAISEQNSASKFAKCDVSFTPDKMGIKKILKENPNSVPGARLETNYHVRFTQPTLKGKKNDE